MKDFEKNLEENISLSEQILKETVKEEGIIRDKYMSLELREAARNAMILKNTILIMKSLKHLIRRISCRK